MTIYRRRGNVKELIETLKNIYEVLIKIYEAIAALKE
jgi:hypothetical protein